MIERAEPPTRRSAACRPAPMRAAPRQRCRSTGRSPTTLAALRAGAPTAAANARSASTRRRRCSAKARCARALMLVGEQPGDQEDLRGPALRRPGRPAVRPRAAPSSAGRATQLYVTNAVKHFKFELRGKRRIHKTPAQREVAACRTGSRARSRWCSRARWSRSAPPRRARCSAAPSPCMRERGQWLTRARRPARAGHAASVGAAAHGARRAGRRVDRLARRPAARRRGDARTEVRLGPSIALAGRRPRAGGAAPRPTARSLAA